MTKKTKTTERVQLSQETIDKMLEVIYRGMRPEVQFAFDSRGTTVFIQNTNQVVFRDRNTNHDVECVTRHRDTTVVLEQDICNEILADISVMALKIDYTEYTKYSYCFYDEIDVDAPTEAVAKELDPRFKKSTKMLRYSKSIGR